MSLILDALKKSEAERQLGKAPGLTTPVPLRRDEEERQPIWRGFTFWLLLAVIATAVALWLARATPGDVAAVDERTGTTADAATHAAREAATSSAAAAPSAANSGAGTLPEAAGDEDGAPARATQAPVVVAADLPPRVVEQSAPTPQDPDFASVERETQAIVAPSQYPAPRAPPLPSVPTAPTGTPVPDEATAASVSVAGSTGLPVETLPRLDQLGGPQRDSLPPLKQTMHVYTEAPEGRFVLIDGRRYREGDQLTESLQLLEIRRDGSVLQLDGLRFLLPRP